LVALLDGREGRLVNSGFPKPLRAIDAVYSA
jgi:hypothetical protein